MGEDTESYIVLLALSVGPLFISLYVSSCIETAASAFVETLLVWVASLFVQVVVQ